MPVGGLYEMSSTMYNGHSTWESTLNDMMLFKGTSGSWQFDRTIESDTENDDIGNCPDSAEMALFPVQIESQDGKTVLRRDILTRILRSSRFLYRQL